MFLHLQDDSPRGRGPGHRLLGQRGTPCDSLIFAQAGLIQQLLKVQWPVPAPVMGWLVVDAACWVPPTVAGWTRVSPINEAVAA